MKNIKHKKIVVTTILFSLVVSDCVSTFAQSTISSVSNSDAIEGGSCVVLSKSIKFGSRDNNSKDVALLQAFLAKLNYLNSQPTGYFGLLTLKAVKNFQTANTITPTGFVGPVTRKIVQEISCGKGGSMGVQDGVPAIEATLDSNSGLITGGLKVFGTARGITKLSVAIIGPSGDKLYHGAENVQVVNGIWEESIMPIHFSFNPGVHTVVLYSKRVQIFSQNLIVK